MSSESSESAWATAAKLDPIDRRILVELQESAEMSLQELGERVGLSHTPCWRRVRRLEQKGIITRRVALLDAKQLGLAVDVFVNVNLRRTRRRPPARPSMHSAGGLVSCRDSSTA